MNEVVYWQPVWTITKYDSEGSYEEGKFYEQTSFEGNLLLNAGITLALQLIGGIGGTAFNAASARIGVGDSSTAAAAAQTGLQAASNKTYKAMQATYPSVSSQTISYNSVFTTSDANYSWQEFTIDNGTTSLNRKVSDQGTKVSGQVWTVTVTLTLS